MLCDFQKWFTIIFHIYWQDNKVLGTISQRVLKVMIEIFLKIFFAVIMILKNPSGHKFAHVTTAVT